MTKIKYIFILVIQIIALIILLQTLSGGGMSLLLGATFGAVSSVVIQFGVIIMALFASAISLYLPTRTHRILRDTQIHLTKYITVLGLFQVLALMLSKVTSILAVGTATAIHPIFMSVMVMLYCMSAFMMPFTYVKGLFNIIKSVEFRDPRNIIRGYFE